MSKPIEFDKDEVALCPNGHGLMLMDGYLTMSCHHKWEAGESLGQPNGNAVVIRGRLTYELICECWGTDVLPLTIPEARAHCLECQHTMIVADERR